MKNTTIDILLIEDNLSEADLIKEMLAEARQQEFSVQHVQSLAEGLSLLQSRNFDVILTDLGLPDSQGLETALSVRNQSKLTPVVVLTVLDDEDAALKSLQMDIQDYLVKCEINATLLIRSIRYAIQRKRDIESLRESERRFTSFMLHVPAAAWMKDLHGRYAYANAEAERILSMPLAALLGKSDEEILQPETARQFRENDARVLAEGGSLQTSEELRQADGVEHHYIVSKFVVPGPDGEPAYVAGVAFDITKTKRLEAEIQRLASFTLLNPNPVLEMDIDGKVTFCNPAAKQILRKVGCNNGVNPFIPQDMPAIIQHMKDKNTQQYIREVEIDGDFIKEVIFLTPQFQSVRFYTMDITERKRAEEALIQAKEEWELTFDSVPDLIAILDNQYRIVRVNRAMAARLGRQPEECVGLTCYKAIHGTESPLELCPHTKAVADARRHDAELHEALLAGDFLVTVTPLLAPDGEMIGVVHVARDITERKKAEKEIEKLNKKLAARAAELEAFNYTVAHDLRRPLTNINGYCQVIRELCGDKLGEQCKGYLREVYEGTLSMNRLIDALLNFSRLAHVEPRRETVDLSAMAHGVAEELKHAEPGRRVTFIIAEKIRADGDSALLRVVLDNLLGNAWKYTGKREEALIEFGTTEVDGKSVWFVRDNGYGFDMADADKLFTPFKRLHGAEECRGFGIGLATVERIIGHHGGRVWAEGEPGKGATFYFTLPLDGVSD